MATLPTDDTDPGILYDTTCMSVRNCLAVGNSATGHTSSTLVLSWDGSTWTASPSILSHAGDPSLTAIGCSNETNCLVAGTSLASYQRIAARLDGSTWREVSIPSDFETIHAIACEGPSQCLVVGSANVNDFGNTTTLIASLSAGNWTSEQGPTP